MIFYAGTVRRTIGKGVLFLASDDNSFVNAENLVVDGGFSLV
jgi:NAD(P)-dependent dehydrogenase (short-subunit alcohol dehydrogenase family)